MGEKKKNGKRDNEKEYLTVKYVYIFHREIDEMINPNFANILK